MTEKLPQKIVFVLPSFRAGGAERVMLEFYHGLTGYDKCMVVVDGEGELKAHIQETGKVKNLKKKSVRRSFFPLLKFLKRNQPDFIISSMAHMNSLVLLLKPFLKSNTKIIIRESTLPSFYIKHAKGVSFVNRLLYRFIYPIADKIVCPAACSADQCRSLMLWGRDKVCILGNPVNIDVLRQKASQLHIPLYHGRLYVCVGRLDKAKGYDRLIAALSAWKDRGGWHLCIIGDGPERALLERQIDTQGLADHVTLAGYQDNPWQWMATADGLLVPSRWEGLPNVVLESLAVGTPVVAHIEAGGAADIAKASPFVRIEDNMRDFLMAMEDIPLNGLRTMRESLLPAEYHVDRIMQQMQKILQSE